MIGQLQNIIIGLLTTLIGYIAGRAWQKFVDQIPYRRARQLWGPVLSGELQVVTSRFDSQNFDDPTGMIGAGDAMALRVLRSYFATIGFRKVEEVYVNEPSLDRTKNLILLGGPDTNAVTRDALDLIRPHVQIAGGPKATMEVHDLDQHSGADGSTPPNRRRRRYIAKPNLDYGIIIRTNNPFNPENSMMIIAGAYGYGSWGGANLALRPEFLERCNQLSPPTSSTHSKHPSSISRGYYNRIRNRLRGFQKRRSWVQFECIFRVGVYDKRPHDPQELVLRPLRQRPREL
jgi:hypothetical protein